MRPRVLVRWLSNGRAGSGAGAAGAGAKKRPGRYTKTKSEKQDAVWKILRGLDNNVAKFDAAAFEEMDYNQVKIEYRKEGVVPERLREFLRPLWLEQYDPLALLKNEKKATEVSGYRFPTKVLSRPKPRRLIVTGKEIHPVNAWALSKFISPTGKILPRSKTGLSAKKQRQVARAIRLSRHMGLMPYLKNEGWFQEEDRELDGYKRVVRYQDMSLPFEEIIPVRDDEENKTRDGEGKSLRSESD